MVRSLFLVLGLALRTVAASPATAAPDIPPAAYAVVVIVVMGTIAIAFLIGRRRGH